MPWKKYRDNGAIMFSQSDTNSIFKSVYIFPWDSANTMRIHVYYSSEVQGRSFTLKDEVSSLPVRMELDGGYINLESSRIEHVIPYLQSLLFADHSLRSIMPEICHLLNVPLNAVLPTLADIVGKPVQDAINLALRDQENKGYDLVYQLLRHYWKQRHELPAAELVKQGLSYQVVHNLAKSIPVDSPYSRQAHDLCLEMLMQGHFQEESNQSLDDGDAYSRQLRINFEESLQGTDQELTDLLYHQLRGLPMNVPRIRNIQVNADTLVRIAESTCELYKEQKRRPSFSASGQPDSFFYFRDDEEHKTPYGAEEQCGNQAGI